MRSDCCARHAAYGPHQSLWNNEGCGRSQAKGSPTPGSVERNEGSVRRRQASIPAAWPSGATTRDQAERIRDKAGRLGQAGAEALHIAKRLEGVARGGPGQKGSPPQNGVGSSTDHSVTHNGFSCRACRQAKRTGQAGEGCRHRASRDASFAQGGRPIDRDETRHLLVRSNRRDAGADRPRFFGLLHEGFWVHRSPTRGQGEFILFAECGDGRRWLLASTHERAIKELRSGAARRRLCRCVFHDVRGACY